MTINNHLVRQGKYSTLRVNGVQLFLSHIPLFGERLPPVGFANEIIRNVEQGEDSSGDKHHRRIAKYAVAHQLN